MFWVLERALGVLSPAQVPSVLGPEHLPWVFLAQDILETEKVPWMFWDLEWCPRYSGSSIGAPECFGSWTVHIVSGGRVDFKLPRVRLYTIELIWVINRSSLYNIAL